MLWLSLIHIYDGAHDAVLILALDHDQHHLLFGSERNAQKLLGTFHPGTLGVDDDLTKKGLRVHGVPVRGTISDIPELVRKYHIVEIIIAITTLKGERLNEVINLCN